MSVQHDGHSPLLIIHSLNTDNCVRIELSAGCGLLFCWKYESFLFFSLFEKAQTASFSIQNYCSSYTIHTLSFHVFQKIHNLIVTITLLKAQ